MNVNTRRVASIVVAVALVAALAATTATPASAKKPEGKDQTKTEFARQPLRHGVSRAVRVGAEADHGPGRRCVQQIPDDVRVVVVHGPILTCGAGASRCGA